MRLSLFILSAVLVSPLDAQDSGAAGSWKAERSKRGDTTVVRTVSGSVWGEKVALVEELRIGSKEGDGANSFGFIQGFAVFQSGVIAVFDGSVPALRLFSPEGKHLRTLGRDGAGPGEYRNQTLGLAVDRDGILLMYDPRNARLNRWNEDGTLLPSWRVPTGLFTNQALEIDTAGNVFIKVTTERPEPGKPWKVGLARLDRQGVLVDTLLPPSIPGDAPADATFFEPQKHWYWSRSGEWVTGFSGAYAITIAAPGRGALRIERPVARVALAPDERRNYQEMADALSKNPMIRGSTGRANVPDHKPYFRWLQTDLDGRIWVDVHGQGETFEPTSRPTQPGAPPVPPLRWREPRRFDVFARDGSYLGRIELPRRTSFSEAKGNRIWTVQRGDDDEQYVVRYRIDGIR